MTMAYKIREYESESDIRHPKARNEPVEDLDIQAGTLTESLSDMNLKVLQKYIPSIRNIISIASSTVVYILNHETGCWEKPGLQVEGTLFLCEQEPLKIKQFVLPRACVFVLNRKGLSNVVIDLDMVNEAEVVEDLITLQINLSGNRGKMIQHIAPSDKSGTSPVLGFWIHGGAANTMTQFNPNNVLRSWRTIRTSLYTILGTDSIIDIGLIHEAVEAASKLETIATRADLEGNSM